MYHNVLSWVLQICSDLDPPDPANPVMKVRRVMWYSDGTAAHCSLLQ